MIQHQFVVGSPDSEKDELIKAVNLLGSIHAQIVSKHTNRDWRWDDEEEMICKRILDSTGKRVKNPNFNIENCYIVYQNYGTIYGIKTDDIWEGLKKGIHQVLVVSNINALNKLKEIFGELAVFLYVYSEINKEEYLKKEYEKLLERGDVNQGETNEYLKRERIILIWHGIYMREILICLIMCSFLRTKKKIYLIKFLDCLDTMKIEAHKMKRC